MRVKGRTTMWAIWVIVWIVGCKILAGMGMTPSKGFWYLLIEALICCFASTIMIKHKVIKWFIFIFLVLSLISCINLVGIFCFVMSLILYFITKKYTVVNTNA